VEVVVKNEIPEGESYECDLGCGFTLWGPGALDKVAEHEKICEFRNKGQFFCNQGCGFCGSFFVVSEHESSCKGIQSEEEIIQEMISRGDFFLCDNNCGFTEIFSVVKEHEKQCKFGRVCTPCEEESEEDCGFECDHGCGFTGTFAAVSEHEKTCEMNSWEQDAEEFLRLGPPPPPRKRDDLTMDDPNMRSMSGYEQDYPDMGGYWPANGYDDGYWPMNGYAEENVPHLLDRWGRPAGLGEHHPQWQGGKGGWKLQQLTKKDAAGPAVGPLLLQGKPKSKGKGKARGKSK
jgi:hypothetical protein